MARRKKDKSKRRKRTAFNLSNAVESVILTNATLQATAGVNVVEFFTGRVNGAYNPGSDGYDRITLPELLGFSASGWSANKIGGNYGSTKTFTDALKFNLKANGARSLTILAVTPIAFRLGKRVLRKPISASNKFLKMAGVGQEVRV